MAIEESSAADALHRILRELELLDKETRRRVLSAVMRFFDEGGNFASDGFGSKVGANPHPAQTAPHGRPSFSANTLPSPKEFLAEKQPKTDVERIACLAYYLTHFRSLPSFKTLDLAKLNTEAAHPKFSNAAYSANNASLSGYLAPASNGLRQISAAGERFVELLPDRDAAREVMSKLRRRKIARIKKSNGNR